MNDMKLPKALKSWGDKDFSQVLKQELESMANSLPLHQATQLGGQVDASNISVLVNSVADDRAMIFVQVGIFFHEIMGGCSCGDEPPSEHTYGEFLVAINKANAQANLTLRCDS